MWSYPTVVVISAFAAGVQPLPKDAVIHALKTNANGTLYAAGAMDSGGFAAQLRGKYLYRTAFPVDRIALGGDGRVFVTSKAMPVTFFPLSPQLLLLGHTHLF